MIPAPIPPNDSERLEVVKNYKLMNIRDTESLDRIAKIAASYFGTKTALVSVVGETDQKFCGKCGISSNSTSREVSFCGYTILNNSPFIVNDALRDMRFYDNPLVSGPPKIRFYAGFPITLEGGFRVGSMCLIDPNPRGFHEEDTEMLKQFAKLAEYDFKHRYQKRLAEALELLAKYGLSEKTKDFETRSREALNVGRFYLGSYDGCVAVFEKNAGRLASTLFNSSRYDEEILLKPNIYSFVTKFNRIFAHTRISESTYAEHPLYTEAGFQRFIGAPIHYNDDVIGCLAFFSKIKDETSFFTDIDREFVEFLGHWLSQGYNLDKLPERNISVA